MAILTRTFVRVQLSQRRTHTKVHVRVRVRRPPTVLDFLYVAHVYDVPMNELALRRVHTVVQEAILPRTFVRVRPSQPRTRTKVRVRVRVRCPPTCWIFCTSYTCTTYKWTSMLYSNELIIIAGVSNQMVFLQDIQYKLFYILIFSIKHVKKL